MMNSGHIPGLAFQGRLLFQFSTIPATAKKKTAESVEETDITLKLLVDEPEVQIRVFR